MRYADDQIVGFEHRQDAERFLADLQERLARFGLRLHPEKTRLIEFGKGAIAARRARGLGKPETFDFLGFTHFCGTRRDGTSFVLGRKPVRKRMRARLRAIREMLRRRLHDEVAATGRWLGRVVRGWSPTSPSRAACAGWRRSGTGWCRPGWQCCGGAARSTA